MAPRRGATFWAFLGGGGTSPEPVARSVDARRGTGGLLTDSNASLSSESTTTGLVLRAGERSTPRPDDEREAAGRLRAGDRTCVADEVEGTLAVRAAMRTEAVVAALRAGRWRGRGGASAALSPSSRSLSLSTTLCPPLRAPARSGSASTSTPFCRSSSSMRADTAIVAPPERGLRWAPHAA